MAEKKYYWLKLKNDFFTSKEMKKLRKIAGGDTYTIIYLKLQLLSLQDSGNLYFDGIEDTFAEELALTIDEEPDNVRATLLFLQKCGLVEVVSENEIALSEVPSLIGSETATASRMRRSRERRLEKCNNVTLERNIVTPECNNVQKSYTDIEIDKDKDKELEIETETETENDVAVAAPAPSGKKKKNTPKHKYGEYNNVLLTDEEYEKLKTEYPDCDQWIDRLSEYIAYKGAKYKSHYVTLRVWIRKDKDGQKPVKEKPKAQNRFLNAQQRDDNYADMLMQAAVQGMGSLGG